MIMFLLSIICLGGAVASGVIFRLAMTNKRLRKTIKRKSLDDSICRKCSKTERLNADIASRLGHVQSVLYNARLSLLGIDLNDKDQQNPTVERDDTSYKVARTLAQVNAERHFYNDETQAFQLEYDG